MILGPPSPCFVELDEAVAQLQAARGDEAEARATLATMLPPRVPLLAGYPPPNSFGDERTERSRENDAEKIPQNEIVTTERR